MNSHEEARCQVKVNRGDSRWVKREECGRPAERDGKCKLHLRVEQRRAENDRIRKEQWDRGKALQDEAEALSQHLGIDAAAHYNAIRSCYDGRFVVDGDWLRSL